MEVQELRVGNYLFKYGEVVKIVEIGIKHKGDTNYYLRSENDNCGYWIDQFKPIPLTEEILFKCCFEKRTDIDCYNINKLDNVIIYSIKGLHPVIKYSGNDTNDYHLSISDTNDYCEYGYYIHISKEIKYLHQLQNLYFALNNQELNIEL